MTALPRAWIWRRLHSLMGLWLVLFLIEHLVTNSQAALLLGEHGRGFVTMVNHLHNLPYLPFIEIGLLGIPLLIHLVWGIQYALEGRLRRPRPSEPVMRHTRHRFYLIQRLSSWVILVLLVVHVVQMRFVHYPTSLDVGTQNARYFVVVTRDPGLSQLAHQLGFSLHDTDGVCVNNKEKALLATYHLKSNEVIASSASFGTVSLLNVRETFKSPFWIGLYTLFVVASVFHAFNGLWTSMLTWGWVIKASAQTRARHLALALMLCLGFLGLASVWGTYFINLKQ